MTETGTQSKFRYDINLLRAIAVVGVILFHYKVPHFSGGFAGVDIFFVISGYLMTRILYNSNKDSSFNYSNFVWKRAVRILPALLFLCLIINIVCFTIYLPNDYARVQESYISSISFISNIWYWKQTGYFNPLSETNILLHTWSLSVEWQFYLLYPIVILIWNHKFVKPKYLLHLFILLTTVLLLISIYATKVSPSASFYLFPSRAWEMLLGGIAFFGESRINSKKIKILLAALGYFAILASFLFFDSSLSWPSVYTVVPTAATALIILSNYNNHAFVRSSAGQFIGRISYSLYLWHWPLYVIATYYGFTETGITAAVLIILSLIAGCLSYYFIESIKIEKLKFLVTPIAILLLTSFAIQYFGLNKYQFDRKTLDLAQYFTLHEEQIYANMSSGECFLDFSNKNLKSKDLDPRTCLTIDNNKRNILLLGDSHAAHFSTSFKNILNQHGINLLQATAVGGLPTLSNDQNHDFTNLMKYMFNDFIPRHKDRIDGIIISGNWVRAYENSTKEDLTLDIIRTLDYIKSLNIDVVVIGQNEIYKLPYPTIAARENEYGQELHKNYFDKNAFEIDEYMSKKLAQDYISIINKNDVPPLSPDQDPYMYDETHLTKYGADLVTKKIFSDTRMSKKIESM